MLINIVLIIFLVLETSNVIVLFFFTDSNKGNGVALFKDWQTSKEYEDIHLFIKYLVYWVAATKSIFIAILAVVVVLGTPLLKIFATAALILTMSIFYLKLYPIIKMLDSRDRLTIKGYSTGLAITIACMIIMLCIGLVAQIKVLMNWFQNIAGS